MKNTKKIKLRLQLSRQILKRRYGGQVPRSLPLPGRQAQRHRQKIIAELSAAERVPLSARDVPQDVRESVRAERAGQVKQRAEFLGGAIADAVGGTLQLPASDKPKQTRH